MKLLQVSHLSKIIREEIVLHDISFAYESFQRVAIAGETGSGKTTLLKSIAGLVQPDGGEVLFEDERVLGPDERLLPGHPRIAYLSQHFELRNNYKVDDFLEMASKVGEKEAKRIYELCQIDHLLKRKTDQLSGGERQRTALARLLTTSPRLLLLDEPYSNLDGLHKQVLKQVINDIVEEGKTSCLMVSHDPNDVLPWAEEVLVLKEGKIVQKGTPEQVYRQPESDYTGGLFGDYNLLSAMQSKKIFGLNEIVNGKRVFVRPETIQLQKATEKDCKGIVTAVYFFGSYYEVEVRFGEVKLFVKTNHPSAQKGDQVAAIVSTDSIWYV
jgi:ABC-type sulfate/molybdate transport systems ATPase subunit